MLVLSTATKDDFQEFLTLKMELSMNDHELSINSQYKAIEFGDQNPVLHLNEFETMISAQSSLFLFARYSGTIVGTLYGYIEETPPHYGHAIHSLGYIDTLVVKRKYRNRGIGTALKNGFFDFLHKENVLICQIHVKSKNQNALRLYQSWDFQIDELRLWKNISIAPLQHKQDSRRSVQHYVDRENPAST